MSAASYYDKAATQQETSPGPMHSGTQGYGQDMRQGMNEQQHGFPQQGYNEQSGDGIYAGQKPNMGNTNYAQGAQQMEGKGAQGAVADNRDTITKCNDNPPDYKTIKTQKFSLRWSRVSIHCAVERCALCARWLATDRRSTNQSLSNLLRLCLR